MSAEILKHMPRMYIGKELDEKLQVLPDYNANILRQSVPERIIALQDIYRVFVPTEMSREIYSKLYLAVLRSLEKKQTIAAVRQYNENSKQILQESYESIIGGSDSFTVIGQSGIGKSSSVSRSIRLLSDNPFIMVDHVKIIPGLIVQAPADASIKGLMLEILRKTDEYLNTNYHYNAIKSRATLDMLIGSVSQVALNHIGVLIIDEIQNVANSKNGASIVGTLTQFINNSGISVCMVGVPEAIPFFDQAEMLARRSLGLQYQAMPYGDEFRKLCSVLLRYRYVKNLSEEYEALYLWLYNHSGGNMGVVVSLIHDTQELLLLSGKEDLNISALNQAYDRRLTMLHPHLHPDDNKISSTKKSDKRPRKTDAQPLFPLEKSITDVVFAAKQASLDSITELRKNNFIVEEIEI